MKVEEFTYDGANYYLRLLDDNSLNVMKGTKKLCNIDPNGNITFGDYSGEIIAEELWKILKEAWKFAVKIFNNLKS